MKAIEYCIGASLVILLTYTVWPALGMYQRSRICGRLNAVMLGTNAKSPLPSGDTGLPARAALARCMQ